MLGPVPCVIFGPFFQCAKAAAVFATKSIAIVNTTDNFWQLLAVNLDFPRNADNNNNNARLGCLVNQSENRGKELVVPVLA